MEAIVGLADKPDAASNDPARGQPSQRPWRLLRRALKWMFLSVAIVFVIVLVPAAIDGISGGLAASRGQTRGPSVDYGALAPYASIALQFMLLWGAIRGARSAGRGNIAEGLANRPVSGRGRVTLFAILILAWDTAAVGTLVWFVAHGGHPPVVPTEIAQLPQNAAIAAIHIAFLALLAPVAEELFFRGWLWTALRKTWPPAWTLTATSALWLSMHALDGTWRPLLLLPTAILLGLARHYGNSVRASLILHLMNNSLVVLLQIAAIMASATAT